MVINPPSAPASNPLYEVVTSSDPVFSFKVIRKSSGAVLFDTSLGGFTFADQFLQLATYLPNKNLYGIGENEQPSFRHSFEKFPNWPLYARDQPPSVSTHFKKSKRFRILMLKLSLYSFCSFFQGRANMYGVHVSYHERTVALS